MSTTVATASSSSSSVPVNAEQSSELLAQGKQARLDKDWPKSLELFENALKLAVEGFGQLSDETAPLYYYYGQALFELAVQQSDMFGEAVHDAQADAAADEEEEQEGAEDEEEEEEEEEYEPEEEEDQEQTNEREETAGDRAEDDQEKEDADADAGAEQQEPQDDFQLAFENLEAARLIYQRNPEKFEKELIDVHSLLGEVYMETDQFAPAEIEFQNALELLRKQEKPEQRLIASQ
jgi:HAT1-interacting factor 1